MPSTKEQREEAWKNLDITPEEADRFTQCFKDENFRKLFREYAEEISDPENKAKYEMEIRQLEADRGVDCQFIDPHPGYVLKTVMNGDQKIFINVAENDKVGKPSSQTGQGADGKRGLQWSIPHSLAPARDDFDKNKKLCQVYDVVFHPDTLRMASKNRAFRQMIDSTAMDSVEERFSIKLDRANVKQPKMKYKGMPQAAVIRKATGQKPKELDPIQAGAYPSNWKMPNEDKESPPASFSPPKNFPVAPPEFATPKYQLIHRKKSDMKDFTYTSSPAKEICSTRPDELVVEVELPLLKSANELNVDIEGDSLLLKTEPKAAKYKLELKLPYFVNEDNGSAKFDKQRRKLTLVLPVLERVERPNTTEQTED